MSDVAENGVNGTSSITSVTEDDSSVDSESDTTESTSSRITPSVVSSTDTDDKLTPCLHNISISSPNATSKSSPQSENPRAAFATPTQVTQFPYGCNPLPLNLKSQNKRRTRQKQRGLLQDVLRSRRGGRQRSYNLTSSRSVVYARENLGATDADNRLSTDLSDTSSIDGVNDKKSLQGHVKSLPGGTRNLTATDCIKDGKRGLVDTRPYFPDMASSAWHQARCFDHYWRHYNFVMEWYQLHLNAVRSLSQKIGTQGVGCEYNMYADSGQDNGRSNSCSSSRRSKSQRQSRRSKRAKSRRKAKERHRAAVAASQMVYQQDEAAGKEDEEDENDVEMEITDEMVQFFATSLKHRIERDKAQARSEEEGNVHLNIEEAIAGQAGPTSAAPTERPGVRRTAEMRQLYGDGAAMIHGMETALQMSFDRISDRYQPKLWPNMPLKIIFG